MPTPSMEEPLGLVCQTSQSPLILYCRFMKRMEGLTERSADSQVRSFPRGSLYVVLEQNGKSGAI